MEILKSKSNPIILKSEMRAGKVRGNPKNKRNFNSRSNRKSLSDKPLGGKRTRDRSKYIKKRTQIPQISHKKHFQKEEKS